MDTLGIIAHTRLVFTLVIFAQGSRNSTPGQRMQVSASRIRPLSWKQVQPTRKLGARLWFQWRQRAQPFAECVQVRLLAGLFNSISSSLTASDLPFA